MKIKQLGNFEGYMRIQLQCRSYFTGQEFVHEVRMTHAESKAFADRSLSIQQILPNLTVDERELFIMPYLPGEIGEQEFSYSCSWCGRRHCLPIEGVSQSHVCDGCGRTSTPFAIVAPA